MKNSKVYPNYSTQETLEFTYECVQKILDNKVEGCLIECGVATGNQLGAMKQCLVDNNAKRTIFGYDSFEGIPFAGENDLTQPGLLTPIDKEKHDLLESTGVTSHSVEDVVGNFKNWELPMTHITLIKGWFQNTVKHHKGKIALLRLDGDLYSSTKCCLEHLLKHMSKGGIIIFDDWELEGSRKAILEFIPREQIVEHLKIAYHVVR